MHALRRHPVPYRISHLVSRLFFRGIYFPHKGAWGWLKLIAQNGRAIVELVHDAFTNWSGAAKEGPLDLDAPKPDRASETTSAGRP
jgi:hypothetical protein